MRLYADYSRDKLLPLLRRSDNYPIQQALDICSQRQFYPEMVYLLGRIGNTSEALALMTRELDDMESAIAFCQEHDDEELWNDLVNYSLDKPSTNHIVIFQKHMYACTHIRIPRKKSDRSNFICTNLISIIENNFTDFSGNYVSSSKNWHLR